MVTRWEGGRGLGEKDEGIKPPQNSWAQTTIWLLPQGKGVGKVGECKGDIDGRRCGFGWEHTMQYTDNVLQNYTPKTYIIL